MAEDKEVWDDALEHVLLLFMCCTGKSNLTEQ